MAFFKHMIGLQIDLAQLIILFSFCVFISYHFFIKVPDILALGLVVETELILILVDFGRHDKISLISLKIGPDRQLAFGLNLFI